MLSRRLIPSQIDIYATIILFFDFSLKCLHPGLFHLLRIQIFSGWPCFEFLVLEKLVSCNFMFTCPFVITNKCHGQLVLVYYQLITFFFFLFHFRCLQSVLPHIHLLWELVLTNEVLKLFAN